MRKLLLFVWMVALFCVVGQGLECEHNMVCAKDIGGPINEDYKVECG